MRALHAALVSFALGLVPASDCLGTVLYPEYVIEADPPVWGPGSVKPDHIPLTVLIRDDIAVEGVRLSDAARAEGLQLIPEEAPWDRDVPEGYRLERYRIMGRLAPETQDIEVELTVEGEAVRKQIVLTEAALSDPPTPVLVEVPRIDPSNFSRPLPSPRVGIAPASKPGPMTAPRLVAVTGRILFQLPDGTPVGVDGATVKVMEPVDILDDNPLGEGVTDVNGDIDFTFIMDGTQDIYVRVEAANGTAVNVGTGLFFHTYARHIDYDAFSGTVIDLGNISWGGNFNTALWLTYAITWAQRSIEGGGYDLDRMHIRYPDDSQEVSWYSPLGGTEGIHLRSDRAWRTSTLYHEYGHHFVYQHAAAIAPAYCNGLCEPAGSCGHCYWCEENEAVAWSEGFPTWIAYLLRRTHAADLGWELPDFSPRDDEYIQGCGEKGGSLERAMSTEGQFTSFLIDLVDGNNENDPAYDTEAMDRTQFDPELILHVATVDRPTNSYTFIADMRDYLQTLPGFTNLDLVHYWSTVRNNGLDEDGIPPTAPTSVSSTTHPVGVSSASNMPVLLFSGGVDDFSGVQAHYVTMTQNNPAAPDESGTTFDGSSLTWPLPLAPGTWYANVRAVDGAGNRSLDHISYGPMLIAPPLPIDLEPTVDYLWENPIVVRNTPDATGTAAGYPAELLPGDAYLNLFFANTSPSGAPGDTLTVVMHLDGNVQEWFPVFRPTIGAGEQFVFTNMGPHNLAGGGRHRVTAKIDITNALPETDELNNNHGVSFVVRPEPLIPGPWQTMPPPPNAEQGSEVIPGTPDNVAGVRLTPAHEFGAVLMHPNDANWYSAYELRAFQPSSGVTNGFDTALATATAGSGIAAIVVAAAGSPTGSFDFGVRANPAIYDYRIRAVDSIPRPLVGVTSLGWTEDDWLSLLEFDFGPGDLGYFNITLSVDYESFGLNQSIDLYWIAQADTAKALAYAVLGQVGRDRFFTTDLNIVGEGTYALAVRRHNAYNLWATAAAIDVATHTSPLPEVSIPLVYPKWPGGFVPTPSFTQDDTLDFPTELLGEVASTYINFAVQNLGSAPTPFFTAKMYVGTEKALTASLGPILPGAWLEYRHPTPFTIGGGRRVLSLVLDPDDLMTELSEQNNVYAMQWGWTGYTIYPGQPLSRPYPPDPAAWLGSVPVLLASNPAPDGEDGDAVPLNFIAPNCDGLRLDPSQAGSGIDWHGVALMPAAGENVDLELFQGGVPAALAYVDDLAGSHSDSSACEFVLVDLGEGAQGVFDAGVYAVTGNQNYVVHAAAAAPLPTPVGGAAYGSFGLSPGTILNLYEIDLVAGTYQFDILNNNQGASLGMSVHPPLSPRQTPWHGKDDLRDGVAHARSAAPGGNVSVTVQVPYGAEGKWCLAVWKPAASDLLQTIGYDLSATGAPASPLCVTIDGTAEAAYGPAHAVQQLPTAFGDSDLGLPGEANGSELDQAFGKIADGNLYLAFTGNLESNLNDLEIFLDVMPGGQHRLLGNNVVIADDALGRMGDDGSGNGLTFDSGFEADAYLTVSCGETPVRVLAYGALLPTGGGGGDGQYIGATTPASGGILYGLQPGDTNGGIRLTLDNSNTGGVYEVVGPYTSPETVTTGVEIAVPLDVIGNPDCVRVTVFVNGQLHDYVSNQVLPSLPPGTGNLGDPRNVDFSALAGSQYFTVCAPGAVGVGNHPEVPDAHRMLHAPAPNPFLAVTTLSFSLDVDTVVDLRIFDIRGRLVRHLVQDQPYPGGIHTVTWDGRDDRGGALAAGVYHARFSAGAAIETRRLIYTR